MGHVLRRHETEAVNAVKHMYEEGMRERGRSKKRWIEVLVCDIKITEVCKMDANDQNKWKMRP